MEPKNQQVPATPEQLTEPAATPIPEVQQKMLFGILSLVGSSLVVLSLIITSVISAARESTIAGPIQLIVTLVSFAGLFACLSIPTVVFAIISLARKEKRIQAIAVISLTFCSLVLLIVVGLAVIFAGLSSLCYGTSSCA